MSKKSDRNKRTNPVEVKRPKLENQPESENQHEKIKTKTRFFGKIKLWFKKMNNAIILFFSFLATISSCVAAYFAFLSHSESHPPQISIIFNSSYSYLSSNNSIDLSMDPDRNIYILLNNSRGYLNFDDAFHNGYPLICNKTRKTIKDFKLKVTIKHDGLDFKNIIFNPSFEVCEVDSMFFKTTLLYKANSLNPGEKILTPIRNIYYEVDLPHNMEEMRNFPFDQKYEIEFHYDISYDIMTKYENLYVNCSAYPNSSSDNNDYFIDRFLTRCFSWNHFTNSSMPDIVAVQNNSFSTWLANPRDGLSDDEFEIFKKEFIKTMKEKK